MFGLMIGSDLKVPKKPEKGFIIGNFLAFLSGLSLGLLVAFVVYVRYQLEQPEVAGRASTPRQDSQTQTGGSQQKLKFTFYDTLRDKKLNISEWVAGERGNKPDDKEDDATVESSSEDTSQDKPEEQHAKRESKAKEDVVGYVLQVGAFKDFSSADRVKAELALLGIFADIQRVMLNGQDVRHRVRLGPYKSIDEMRDMRRRLENNNMEFMLLELRAGQDST